MARTVEKTVYKFNELSDEAKKKARDWWREGGLDYEWWEFCYDEFVTLCEFFGIEMDTKRRNNPKAKGEPAIYFTGFYSQGSGSSFAGSVDVQKMLKCVEDLSWQKEFPSISFRFMTIKNKNEQRIIKAIKDGLIDCSCSIRHSNRETAVSLSLDWDSSDPSGDKDRRNIDSYICEIEEYLQDIANKLNSHLYKSLETEYEWRMADEQVDETCISNEYEFEEDGSPY